MKIVLIGHSPDFSSLSMPRYAALLKRVLEERGHEVSLWTSPSWLGKIPCPEGLRKWGRYVDQFLIYPGVLRQRVQEASQDTLFVLTDHALGMWLSAIEDHAHVVHCHDFLAQFCALGRFPEWRPGLTGRIYQGLIRRGFRRGRHFISVSEKTRGDLHGFLERKAITSEVVYNAPNRDFLPIGRKHALKTLAPFTKGDISGGFFLHVGGNQWYKNRSGVLEIYDSYQRTLQQPLPLLLLGPAPASSLKGQAGRLGLSDKVMFISGAPDSVVQAAYAAATALIFPSLEEGFGWPILEAQGMGCPVITTDHAPMTEVGGEAALYLRRRSSRSTDSSWAEQGAELLRRVAKFSGEEREAIITRGLENARRFDPKEMGAQLEKIYARILKEDEQ